MLLEKLFIYIQKNEVRPLVDLAEKVYKIN